MEDSVLYKLAVDKFNSGNYNSALGDFLKLADEGRNDFRVYNYLGVLYSYAQSYENAIKYFRETIDCNPEYANAYANLGIIYNNTTEFDKAGEYFEKSLQTDKSNYLTYYNYGIALKESGKIEDASEAMKKCVSLNNSYAAAHFHLAILYLMKEDYQNGWKEYEWGYKSGDLHERTTDKPRWNGENFEGKSLYVYSDQGFGDTFQFLRYLPEVKKRGGKIILEVEPQITGLIKRFGNYDELIEGTQDRKFQTDFDLHIPLLSIPCALGNDFKVISKPEPFFTVGGKKVRKWKEKIKNNGKINAGFVWTGNPHPPINRKRHMTLSDFSPLFKCANVNWYSLQKGEISQKEYLKNIADFDDLGGSITDFEDTAAIIENLDLVVTIDTSVAHLAGSLDKKCWLMLANVPDWRWGMAGESCKWYPSIKLFRQKKRGDWVSVTNQIRYELSNLSGE